MKKSLLIFLMVLIFFFNLALSQEKEIDINSDSIRSLALDEALKCIKMTQKDLTLRKDYVDIDSFRLEIINHHMINLMQSLNYSQRISSQLLSSVSLRASLLLVHLGLCNIILFNIF